MASSGYEKMNDDFNGDQQDGSKRTPSAKLEFQQDLNGSSRNSNGRNNSQPNGKEGEKKLC